MSVQFDLPNMLEVPVIGRWIVPRVFDVPVIDPMMRPAECISCIIGNVTNQVVVVVVVEDIGIRAAVGDAHELHVGVDVQDAVAIEVFQTHEPTAVDVVGVIVQVMSRIAKAFVDKVVMRSIRRERRRAGAWVRAAMFVVSYPHDPVALFDVIAKELCLVIHVVHDCFFVFRVGAVDA